jgi:hypothetical protein
LQNAERGGCMRSTKASANFRLAGVCAPVDTALRALGTQNLVLAHFCRRVRALWPAPVCRLRELARAQPAGIKERCNDQKGTARACTCRQMHGA